MWHWCNAGRLSAYFDFNYLCAVCRERSLKHAYVIVAIALVVTRTRSTEVQEKKLSRDRSNILKRKSQYALQLFTAKMEDKEMEDMRKWNYDEQSNSYCVNNYINPHKIWNEVETKGNEARQDGDIELEMMDNEVEHMFKTSIFMDWDRRTSVRIEAGKNRNGEEGFEWYQSERSLETEIANKCGGVNNFKRKGRNKFQFVIDVGKVAAEISKEQEWIWKSKGTKAVLEGGSSDNAGMGNDNNGNEEDVNGDVVDVNGNVPEAGGDDNNEDGNVARKSHAGVRSKRDVGAGMEETLKRTRAELRAQGIVVPPMSKKIRKRARRRDRIDSSTFKLFEWEEDGPNRKNRKELSSEMEWFRDACNVATILMRFMEQKWVEVPHLRCVHLKEKGRKMVSVCSARIEEEIVGGGWKQACTVGFMVQDSGRDVVCVNVIQRKRILNTEEIVGEEELVCCSCDVRRKEGIIVESQCRHQYSVRGNGDFMKEVRLIVKKGCRSDDDSNDVHNKWFGSWIVKDRDCIKVDGEDEDKIICTQIDQVNGKEMTRRRRTIARRWSCWNAYDTEDNNFVCCIRSALGSGIGVTKMKCTQCRPGPRRKCRHEAACMKILAEAGSVTINDNGEMKEKCGPVEPTRRRTYGGSSGSNSEYSTSDEDLEKVDGKREELEIVDDDDKDEHGDTIPSSAITGRCLDQPETFFSSWKVRPLYMCPAERHITKQLTDRIEKWDRLAGGLSFTDPDGSPCEGTLLDKDGRYTCTHVKQGTPRILPRKVTLLTLNHDLFSVVLNDWVCQKCGYENRYNGEAHGIYPAAKHRAFTVELMYFWLHECVERGISFRAVFELTNNLQNTCSYRRKFRTKRLDVLAPQFRRDRRLANEAMRKFCANIDMEDESTCTKRIFSCTNCEVVMNSDDCKQLGLVAKSTISTKRFRSLVMDGKVIGALREFPVETKDVHSIKGAKGLTSKLLNNRDTRSALKYMIQGVRGLIKSIEYGRAEAVKHNIAEKNGRVHVRLGFICEIKGVTKSNYEHYLKIIRWYCDNRSCLCKGTEWTSCLSHEQCADMRELLKKKKGCHDTSRVMSLLFSVNGDGEEGNPVDTGLAPKRHETDAHSVQENTPDQKCKWDRNDGEDDSSDSSNGSEHSDRTGRNSDAVNGIRAQWVTFNVPGSFKCTEVLDCLLENIQFAFGEPITLGFFPYFTHKRDTVSAAVEGSGQDDGEAGHVYDFHHYPDGVGNGGHGRCEWDKWSLRYISLLEIINGDHADSSEEDRSFKRDVVNMLTEEVEQIHRDTSTVLLEFCYCRHDGTPEKEYPCGNCTRKVEQCGEHLRDQNCIVGNFLSETTRVGKRAPILSRTASRIVHELIDLKLEGLKKLQHEVVEKTDCTVWRYWKSYGHYGDAKQEEPSSLLHDDEEKDSQSVYVFPGRKSVRPTIQVDGKDKTDCTKHYYTSRPDMTSFISLQCACRHPKVIGFTLIKQVESIAMAISTVLGFLKYPPRTLWYDNACNFYDSALLRTPFLLRSSTIMVDRFHYQGHTCSNQFNPDRFKSLVGERSVAAEVMNAVMEKSASFIRYLKGENIKPYLTVLFATHNFKAMLKDRMKRKDLPLLDYCKEYNKIFPCLCAMCRIRPLRNIWIDVTLNSIDYIPIQPPREIS